MIGELVVDTSLMVELLTNLSLSYPQVPSTDDVEALLSQLTHMAHLVSATLLCRGSWLCTCCQQNLNTILDVSAGMNVDIVKHQHPDRPVNQQGHWLKLQYNQGQ